MAGNERDHQNVGRSMAAVTVETMEQNDAWRKELWDSGASHVAQTVQLQIQGTVSRKPRWTESAVTWPWPFLMRVDPLSHRMHFSPHFNHGLVLLSGGPVTITPHVHQWIVADDDTLTGALIRMMIWMPEAPKRVEFQAELHLTFLGYAAPHEDEEDIYAVVESS